MDETIREALTEERLRAVDPQGMYDLIRAFPEQVRRGRDRAREISSIPPFQEIDHVVLVGMGGSAIAGDLVGALAEPDARIPVTVVRSYTLPGFVDEHTLVVISSYSGNTEETLAGLDMALSRNAPIFCLTSNGRVEERAQTEKLPCHLFPGGMPPRAALGYSFTALLQLMEQLNLLNFDGDAWEETYALLGQMAEELGDLSGNQALGTARVLTDRVPIISSGPDLLAPVNMRWRCQFQENAERLAFGNLYPEWNHNEIMGWADGRGEWLLERLAVITLKDADDHPRVKQRMEIVRDLLEDKAGEWIECSTRGESRLARMLSLVYLGDWTSLYLAALTGADPMSISLIEDLKTRMFS